MSMLTTSIQHLLEVLAKVVKEKKKDPDRKEEAKLYFVNNMILLIGSLNKSTKKTVILHMYISQLCYREGTEAATFR